MGKSFTYRGIDFGDTDHGVIVLGSTTDQGLPDNRFELHDLGGDDGAVSQSMSFKPRFWTYECRIMGSSRDELRRRFNNVKRDIDPRDGDGLLIEDGETALDSTRREGRMCRINGPINPAERGLSLRFQLNWAAAEACSVATSETNQAVTLDADPKAFSVPASGNLAGNAEVGAVFEITNNSATPVSQVVLTNTTRSEALTWEGSLAQNDKLRIDTTKRRQHIEKSTDGGSTWANAMTGLQAGDPFPVLTPEAANSFTLAGVPDGALDITYRARFL